jgi:23S rRNA (cytosine1962-C5)-methyltransferase
MKCTAVIRAGKEKQLVRHHPWVFSRALEKTPEEDSCIAQVLDSNGVFIAWGAWDSQSHIPLRLMSWKQSEEPDEAWFREQVHQALLRRKELFKSEDTNAFRLVFGEADMLGGFAVDLYARIIRIIVSSRYAWSMREVMVKALQDFLKPDLIVLNTDSAFCGIEKLKQVTAYYKDGIEFTPQEAFEPILIRESGFFYSFVPGTGQKSGFYCDQRENRKAAAFYAKDRTVLDVCSYTGAFTIHCLAAGAKSVDALDRSDEALHQLLSNVHFNIDRGTIPADSISRVTTTRCDAFEQMRLIEENHYDMMILDPPKLAMTPDGVEAALKAYKDLNRLAMAKIASGGIIVTCSCSGNVDREQFRTMLAWSAKDSGVEIQILATLGQAADHPVRLSFPESEYLKVYILRVIK